VIDILRILYFCYRTKK